MSFNISLSGLNAASSELSVAANDIANVGTTGFKESRAQFADIYAVSAFGNSNKSIGSGVILTSVTQQFSQGNLDFTDSSLDLAISGQGFFIMSPNLSSQDRVFSRSGAFGVDANGYIVNPTGQYLQVFPVNQDGTVTSTSLSSTQPLQLPAGAGSPAPTTQIDIELNLPSTAAIPTVYTTSPVTPADFAANFNITDANSYNHSTSVTVYDSLGNTHIQTMYYVRTDAANNTWETRTYVDGLPVTANTSETITFDNSGNLTGPTPGAPLVTGEIDYAPFAFTNGATPMDMSIRYAGTTQFSSPFAVSSLNQDGSTVGRLSGLDISETGVVRANYTNGTSQALGKVALADFPNSQGLRQIGNTAWAETIDSGTALPGEAGTGRFGSIQAGALEASNSDLTAELVNLITAQRNFQANSKAIETANSVTQTILQIG